MGFKLNTQTFINKANLIHNYKYDYSKCNYINSKINIIIICKKCNYEFLQKPNTHLSKHGCPNCNHSKKLNTQNFINKANLIHNYKYNYSKVKYVNIRTLVTIICDDHEFYQTPHNHLNGYGCNKCVNNIKLTKEKFIEKSNLVHNYKYNYDFVNYINIRTPINIFCLKHKLFKQTPHSHLNGYGCSKCSKKISNIETEWLDQIEIQKNIKIERQFYLKKIKITVDGFHIDSKTVFQFHGDFWHGNPNKYNLNHLNKVTKCSFGELYNRTLDKEFKIIESGYNLIVIWETDYNNLIKGKNNALV